MDLDSILANLQELELPTVREICFLCDRVQALFLGNLLYQFFSKKQRNLYFLRRGERSIRSRPSHSNFSAQYFFLSQGSLNKSQHSGSNYYPKYTLSTNVFVFLELNMLSTGAEKWFLSTVLDYSFLFCLGLCARFEPQDVQKYRFTLQKAQNHLSLLVY